METTPTPPATMFQKSPVLSDAQGRCLIAEGWAAADLHVHTLYSYDVIPVCEVDPLTLYRKARRLGMTYIAFTDHDTMDAYDQIGWSREGLVPAVEVKILDLLNVGHTIHINVFTLNRRQFHEIQEIAGTARDVERLVAYLKDEHLPYIFNHPFWHEPGERLNLQAVLDLVDLFPVLEYNQGRIARINGQVLRVAQATGRGIAATTDTHSGRLGRAFTVARGATFAEYFDHIQNGLSFIVPASLNLSFIQEETTFRIGRLLDKADWLYPYTFYMLTGSEILDGLIARLTRVQPARPSLHRKMLMLLLQAASLSGIPGSLYLLAQHSLADRISELLDGVEIAPEFVPSLPVAGLKAPLAPPSGG